MGRLCGGAHEISGIPAPLWLHGWVVVDFIGWVGGCWCGWWWDGWCGGWHACEGWVGRVGVGVGAVFVMGVEG